MKEPFLNERKRDFDWPLLAAAAALVVIGVLFIFSASGEAAQDLPFYRQKFFLQIVWCIVGVGAAAALCMIDYIKVARWAIVLYWVSIILLLAVLVLGKMVNGGRRWVTVLGFGMQPSEFAKISFIFLMAHYLSRPAEELRRPRVFFGVLGYTVLPFLLILKEPDLGSSLVFLSMCLALMFVAGVPKRFLIPLIATGAACVALVVGAVLLTSPSQTGKVVTAYQRKNILNFLGLATDYNVSQALISVGSGGFFGKGWRHGTQH